MMTLNGNYRIVKPMVWRRSDLQGGLANGEHLFSKKKDSASQIDFWSTQTDLWSTLKSISGGDETIWF